jgi:hypothetical protein
MYSRGLRRDDVHAGSFDDERGASGAGALRELYQRRGLAAAGRGFEDDATALEESAVDFVERVALSRLRVIEIDVARG